MIFALDEKPLFYAFDRKCVGAAKNLITFSSSMPSVYPVKIYSAILVLTVRLFSSLLPVSLKVPVTRHLRNPDNFVVQHFSFTLKENFLQKIMLSFSPTRTKGR